MGKTHLAVALGVKAVENVFSVAFFRLEELLLALKRDAELPPSTGATEQGSRAVSQELLARGQYPPPSPELCARLVELQLDGQAGGRGVARFPVGVCG